MIIIHYIILCSLTAGADYSPVSEFVVFSLERTLQRECVEVFILEDAILEQDEVFFVDLDTTDTDVDLPTQPSTVIILDNDGVCLKASCMCARVPLVKSRVDSTKVGLP